MTEAYDKSNRPYRGSVFAGDVLYLSGRLGMSEGQLPSGVGAQTTQAVSNVAEELGQHGLNLHDIVKVTVLLVDMDDYASMNEVYVATLPQPLPARTCFAVRELPYGGLVELEVVARRRPEAAGSSEKGTSVSPISEREDS